MLGRPVGILTASALGASAFLLPPNIAPVDNDEALTITPEALNAKHIALKLPCSECAFNNPQEEKTEDVDENGESLFWIQGGANNVVVNISIHEDGERVLVNGETIYPLSFQAETIIAQRIYVDQVAASTAWVEIEAGTAKTTPLEVTGHGVSVMREEVVSPEGHMLIPIKHSIYELERQPVSLDTISIKVLKTSEGELFIMHVEAEKVEKVERPDDSFGPPPEDMPLDFLFPPHFDHHKERPGPPHEAMKECDMLPASLCKLRNLLEDKFRGMRMGMRKGGCHGRKHKGGPPHGGRLPGHIKPHFLRPGYDEVRPHHHMGRPHHGRPHAHGHHHGRHGHHFMHSFTRGITAVLIPTMAGVAVGMFVSLIGLVVGRLIGFLWIKLYRKGRRGYKSVHLDEAAAEEHENEKYLVVNQEPESEPLPVYEEAPAYEAAEKE